MVVMSKEKFDYFIEGDKGKYEVVIGLEVHAQVFQIQNFSLAPQLNLELILIIK